MTAGAAGEARGIGRNARIGTITLIRGAVAQVRAAGRPLVLLWLALSATVLALEAVARQAGVSGPGAGLDPGRIVVGVAGVVIAGLSSALAVRLLLQGPAGWRRIDRPFLECAGLFGLSNGMFAGASWIYAALVGQGGGAPILSLAFAVGFLATGYVSVKLVLWPIARLMGRHEVTAGRSWRLMRKVFRGYILAHALLFLPLVVVYGAVIGNLGAVAAGGSPVVGSLFMVAVELFAILSLAIDVTIYTFRVENPATVADVFD